MDRYLDTTRTGPLYLKQKHIAELVVTTIRRGAEELGHYNLEAYVVMANHVHLLVVPYISPTRFLLSLKSYTARQANKLLGRTGEPFWQQESYDHWVRDEAERRRIISYQCCPGKVVPTDGKFLPLNVLWPVLPGNDLKSRGRKWPPERSIPTRHNGG